MDQDPNGVVERQPTPWIIDGIDISDAPMHVKIEALSEPHVAAARVRLRNEAIERSRGLLRKRHYEWLRTADAQLVLNLGDLTLRNTARTPEGDLSVRADTEVENR